MTSQALTGQFVPVPIPVQDQLWLDMDRPNNLMVIDSLIWLGSSPDWDAVRNTVQERMVERYPVFRCRPEKVGGRVHWARDPDFRLSRHVRKVGLRGVVDEDRVRRYVASQRSKSFDREHPLWSMGLIDNVVRPDGSIGAAVLMRMHHSIADGIRLTELALGLTDPIGADAMHSIGANVGAPLKKFTVGGSALATVRTGRRTLSRLADGISGVGELIARDLRDPLGVPGRAVSGVGELAGTAAAEVSRLVADPERAIDLITYVASLAPGGLQAANTTTESLAVLAQRNPDTVWSGAPGTDKDVVWAAPVPLTRVREIARGAQGTVNDVLIGAIAGMLSAYLAEHDTSLKEVAWLIPVSLQPFGLGMPDELGNHFALVNFRMPLDIDDRGERLREIHKRTMRIKNSQETLLTFGVQRAIASSPKAMSVSLTNLFANLAVGVLTNVPGPRQPVAMAGTPVDAILGWAPCSGNQPMTVCIYSYAGQVYLSLGVDAALIPDADRMAELLEIEIDQMHADLAGSGA